MNFSSPPPPPAPPPDPALEAQKQQAAADQLAALQAKLTGDTSSIMARYGTMRALGINSPIAYGTPVADVTQPAKVFADNPTVAVV